MKILPWKGKLLVVFLAVALAFNLSHYAVFRDSDYIFKFILAQLGFLPISVYLVTVVINQLLGNREKQIMLKKLNMVIGSFFSEVGTELLRFISAGEGEKAITRNIMLPNASWKNSNYSNAKNSLKNADHQLSVNDLPWLNLCTFLKSKRDFLLSLLGNPNLLEHESFTELLWAVFHLAEELSNRSDLTSLPQSDYQHLLGDVTRVHVLLLSEWLDYMEHLQHEYPFLFSLAVRTNPYTPEVKVEVT